MSSRSRVKYGRLKPASKSAKRRSEDDYYDDQFDDEDSAPVKPPLKSIALATVLFLLGSGLLTIGSLMLAGVIGDNEGGKATPLLVIGVICFLPGFYNVRTAYYAWRGGRGFSYADIPTYAEDD